MNSMRVVVVARDARAYHGLRFSAAFLLVIALALVGRVASSAEPGQLPTAVVGSEVLGTPWTGSAGITETVDQIMARDSLTPKLAAGTIIARPEPKGPDRRSFPNDPDSPATSGWPVLAPGVGASLPYLPQTVGVNFLGIDLNEAGYIPPDSMGAVGPTQVMVIANGRIKVFDKTGVLGALNTTTDTFFATVRNVSSTSDPHIRYDRLTGRWFVVMINVSTPNRVLIAVSSGPIITGTASFTFYQFQQDTVGTVPNGDTGGLADYPTLGVDKNALYIGVNVFNSTLTAYIGSTVFVVNKTNLMGGTLTVTVFRDIASGSNSSLDGPYTPQGVDNDDPGATEGYFIGVSAWSYGRLYVRRVSTPGGAPVLSANLSITVPTTTGPIDPASKGGAALDAIDDRLFAAALHKNKITGVATLWTAHNIQVDASGVASGSGGRDGSRWYQIGSLTGAPTVIQSGTLFDSAASPLSYWMPSVAMSGQGHMALGCSRTNSATYASVAVSGRLSGDALGTIQAPTLAQAGVASYSVSPARWGDFSQVTIDPNDDQTMWTFQEYVSAPNVWAVRSTQLRAPLPATPSSCSPASVTQGATNVNVIVTGTTASGTAFFDPGPDTGGPGFASHLTAAVSGTGVTVNSVTFTDATHFTMNITVTAGAATGARNVTVTNPDGQTAVGTGILTINAPCPPITGTVSGGGTVCAGSSSTVTVTVAGGTSPYTVTLDNSGGTLSGPGLTFNFTVTPGGTTTYGVQSLTDKNGCTGSGSSSATVTVVPPPTTATVGTGKGICSGGTTAGLGGNTPSTGNGQWSIVTAGVTGTFSPNATTGNATFTHTSGAGPITLRWTISNPPCTASMAEVVVAVIPSPAVTGFLPANGSSGFVGGSVSWTATNATTYDVYLDTVNPPQKLLVQGTATTTAATPVWFSSTPYYWQIVAHGPCGNTTSSVSSFTTGTCGFTGAAPTLVTPADGASSQPIATTLTWNPLAGTSHYDVYLGTTNPPTVRYRAVYDPATSLPVQLTPGKTHYWQVKAVPVCGNSAVVASVVHSFTTVTNGFSLTSSTPAFLNRWTIGTLSVLGSGFLATTMPFTDLAGHSAGAYTRGPWTATQIDGTVAADLTAPAGRYDVGVTNTGTEVGRLSTALALRAFTDVDETAFFFESSSRVADAGLMEADFDAVTAGPQFAPTTVVTRALMAEYLAKAYQWIRTRTTTIPTATCTPSGGGSTDFPDVPCSHPDWLAIHWIKTWGVTAGANCVPGPGLCYLPDASITRGQMVTFLSRLEFGSEGAGTVLQGFLDGFGANDPGCATPYPACTGWIDLQLQVPPATWPHSYVNVAYQDRLTNGCGGTLGALNFCTGQAVTRGQMAEFLGRTVGLVPTP